MRQWVPPRTLADRQDWAKQNPWIAGIWIGVSMLPVLMLIGLRRQSVWISFITAVVITPFLIVGVVLLSKAFRKRGWGERATSEKPTIRRVWVRLSDSHLTFMLILGALTVVFGAITLIQGDVIFIVFLIVGGLALATAIHERSRRRREP